MTAIRFIIQSSAETTADNAYELQQYLKNYWKIETEAEPGENNYQPEDSPVRGEGQTVDLLTILLHLSTAYGALRFSIDLVSGFSETRQAFQDMLKHLKTNMNDPSLCVWMEVEDQGEMQRILVSTQNLEQLVSAVPVIDQSK